MKFRFQVIFCVYFICFGIFSANALAQEKQIVAGAGPSEEICKMFFAEFNEINGIGDYEFVVMEGSVKHKGGLINSDKFFFGRTGRPLSEKEKALGKEQIFLAKVPITFAKGLEVNVSQLSMEEIEKIFTRKITNWKEVGGPDASILLVGREQSESLFMTLKEEYPFFNDVTFAKVFKKDDDVVNYLSSPEGKHAIAFGAKPNFTQHNLLTITDFSTGVRVGLVYDLKNKDNPVIQRADEYAESSDWKEIVDKTTMLRNN
jgi:hypothetical protein